MYLYHVFAYSVIHDESRLVGTYFDEDDAKNGAALYATGSLVPDLPYQVFGYAFEIFSPINHDTMVIIKSMPGASNVLGGLVCHRINTAKFEWEPLVDDTVAFVLHPPNNKEKP